MGKQKICVIPQAEDEQTELDESTDVSRAETKKKLASRNSKTIRPFLSTNLPFADKIGNFLHGHGYGSISGVLIITSLFLQDIRVLCIPKEKDPICDCFLIMLICVFFVEFCCFLYSTKGYIRFYFWLDLLGTLSMLPDVAILFSNVDASFLKSGRMARTANSLRFSRIIIFTRLLRMTRIIRLWKFLHIFNDERRSNIGGASIDGKRSLSNTPSHLLSPQEKKLLKNESMARLAAEAEENTSRNTKSHLPSLRGRRKSEIQKVKSSSRVGLKLADLITKKVVIGVLVLALVLPLLATCLQSLDVVRMGTYAQTILTIIHNETDNEKQNNHIDIFLNEIKGISPAVELKIKNETKFIDSDRKKLLRPNELLVYWIEDDENTIASVSVDHQRLVRREATFNIINTFLIIFTLGGLASLITHDAETVVVQPLSRVMSIITKLTQTICLVTDNLDDQHHLMKEMLETELVEHVVNTVAMIFDPLTNKNGKKQTQLKNKNTVLSINFVERKRNLGDEMDELLKDAHNIKFKTVITAEDHPELQTIESLIFDENISPYFKSYCAARLRTEHFSFMREIHDLLHGSQTKYKNICKNYICNGCDTPIDISSRLRRNLEMDFNRDIVEFKILTQAKQEVMNHMNEELYDGFLKSNYVTAYVMAKENKSEENRINKQKKSVSSTKKKKSDKKRAKSFMKSPGSESNPSKHKNSTTSECNAISKQLTNGHKSFSKLSQLSKRFSSIY